MAVAEGIKSAQTMLAGRWPTHSYENTATKGCGWPNFWPAWRPSHLTTSATGPGRCCTDGVVESSSQKLTATTARLPCKSPGNGNHWQPMTVKNDSVPPRTSLWGRRVAGQRRRCGSAAVPASPAAARVRPAPAPSVRHVWGVGCRLALALTNIKYCKWYRRDGLKYLYGKGEKSSTLLVSSGFGNQL